MGELPHSLTQTELVTWLRNKATQLRIIVATEIRIQVSPERYRVADLAVWRKRDIGTRIPTVPPFLVIEILSAEDRIVRVTSKLKEYLSAGVEYVWLVDPREKAGLLYTPSDPGGSAADVLRTSNPDIELDLATLLKPQDEA